MMRLALPTLALLAAGVPAATAQTAADSAGIRQAALDYIEGWYGGDSTRMRRALHPELAKRIVFRDGGLEYLRDSGASELVAGTASGAGTRVAAARRRTDVTILDIFNRAASARIDAGGWIDYLHLVHWRGRWVIVNVLWELRPDP